MSDLVAEARRVAILCKAVVDAGAAGDLPYALLDDLADEIQRLRGALEDIAINAEADTLAFEIARDVLAEEQEPCEHEWVDPSNERVQAGTWRLCLKCMRLQDSPALAAEGQEPLCTHGIPADVRCVDCDSERYCPHGEKIDLPCADCLRDEQSHLSGEQDDE